MNAPTAAESTSKDARSVWWKEPHLWLLIGIVVLIYFARLSVEPVRGEETRWAQGALHMMVTGDYVVPRQQGQVFPERPPMNSWLMAVAAWARGAMDPIAVRLPSVIAVLLTSILVYLYARNFLTTVGAFAAGLIFATFGQVLQIGRLGESEALLTCLITASLLGWHYGYLKGWSPHAFWTLGYTMAALAALTKGMQGPVYFVVITTCYLLVRRDWRTLLSWGQLTGGSVMILLIGAWQIPFYLATDAQATRDIWTGLVMDRITLAGLAKHLATYPLETLGCLLPWSPMLIQLWNRSFRESLRPLQPYLLFLGIAVLITYPSVWLVTGARGRYFMPLYPCIALVLGAITQQSIVGLTGTWARRGWNRFLWIVAACGVAGGMVVVAASVWTIQPLIDAAQPMGFAILFLVATVAIAGILVWSIAGSGAQRSTFALSAVAILLGLSYTGVILNINSRNGYFVREGAQAIKASLPHDTRLVSFGPLHHRFIYHYGETIQQAEWPMHRDEVSPGVTYFCIDYNIWDTPELRSAGRGRTWSTTPGTLPFRWRQIAKIPLEREYMRSRNWVIIGEILPEETRVSSADDNAVKR